LIKANQKAAIPWAWKIFATGMSSIKRIPLTENLNTLDKISSQLPNGVYTTFRTFGCDKVLPLEPQFARLEKSAALVSHSIFLNRQVIRKALREALEPCAEQEMRIRLTLDLSERPGTIYLSAERLITPLPSDYEYGVSAVTIRAQRENPKAKQTNFLLEAEKVRDELQRNVNEILMVDEVGDVLEGLTSNFFGVKQGEVWTEDERVLPGIVRSMVLKEARTAGIKAHFQAINLSEISILEEALLTSASRSVLPVREIDGQTIGTGKPGSITRKLMDLYDQSIQRQLESV
jgi:branched-chain amino acid aminotransferase